MSMALVMAQMPDVWRKVLAEHLADERGRCRECRNANGETASWPCQTYRVAQEAKWVSEGNLPGTGPHGSDGPSANPRLSRLDDRVGQGGYSHPAPGDYSSPITGGHGLPSTGGYGLPTTGGYGLPTTGGYSLPGTDAYERRPSTGGFASDPLGAPSGQGYSLRYDAPGHGGPGYDEPRHGGSYYGDRPSSGGYGLPDPVSAYPPVHEDAAMAFGGGPTSSAPALASLPPLPASAAPAPAPEPAPGPIDWSRDPFASDEPRRPSWSPDESAPYGSTVDAPYGSSFGVDDLRRSSYR